MFMLNFSKSVSIKKQTFRIYISETTVTVVILIEQLSFPMEAYFHPPTFKRQHQHFLSYIMRKKQKVLKAKMMCEEQ